LRVTREAMRALSQYAWPGNVRELRAEVMRWAVFCDDVVNVNDLAAEIRSGGGSGGGGGGGSEGVGVGGSEGVGV